MSYCPHCGANIAIGAAYCAACGRPATLPPAASGPVHTVPPGYAPQTNVHIHTGAPPAGKPISQATAIVGLILNIVIWPGLGSLIGGEMVGWAQGFLMLLGAILTITIIGALLGIPLMIGMWVWGIVTGVQMINRANAQQQAAMRYG